MTQGESVVYLGLLVYLRLHKTTYWSLTKLGPLFLCGSRVYNFLSFVPKIIVYFRLVLNLQT
jgi:hypothetical protein